VISAVIPDCRECGKSGIHNHHPSRRISARVLRDLWLWIPGSSRSLSSGRQLRAGPVGSAPE
jgi:hypothetical protein